jgi:chemotaxis protein MotB
VIEYFIAQGLPAARFSARGYGEHRPVASNATAEGRARNRRIAVTILPDELAGADTTPPAGAVPASPATASPMADTPDK